MYNLDVALEPDGSTAEITVSVDETLGHYAEWLGIPTQRIRSVNGMGRNSTIRVNSRILIPAAPVAVEQFAAARLEYHMAQEEDFYSQYKVGEVRSRPLRRGETLWDICSGDDAIPLWLFKKYNKHLDQGLLVAGTEIWIPVVEEKTAEDAAVERDNPSGSRFPYHPESARPLVAPARPTP